MKASFWIRLHAYAAYALLACMAFALWTGLARAQPAANLEGAERVAQRIFYAHMGANVMALTGFAVSFAASLAYLWRRRLRWDSLAAAGVEVGLMGALGILVTGSLWAKPTWNTYWTWDPRLTTTTVLVLAYVAYLLVRNGLENVRTRALFASLYALLAYALVPVTYYSAVWFRSIHPLMFFASNDQAQGDFSAALGPTMRFALQAALAAFALLAATLIVLRWRQLRLDAQVRTLLAQLR